MQREYWVDYAKAIGIVLVVYGHVARGLYGADLVISNNIYALLDSVVYSFHMPLFFFLSGLFFYGSFLKKGCGSFVLSKVDTVVYPYLIWSIMQGSIEVFLSQYTNGNVSYSEVSSLLWSPRAQFWFLYSLFFIFAVSAVLYAFLLKAKVSANIVTASLLIISVILYSCCSILPDVFLVQSFSQNFVFFIFGVFFSFYLKTDNFTRLPLALLFLCFFLIGQFVYHIILELNYGDRGVLSLCLALISILFVVSVSVLIDRKVRCSFAVFIGASSMAIYLMHILAGSGVRVILKSFLGIESYMVHLSVGMTVALFAPLLAVFILRRLNVSYVFSAPIHKVILYAYYKILRKGS
ncbi:MAG: acyltransferase family protein [Alphaproteobacteria bacterium]